MIQSVKVDVVYYSIGSDFEMEFNLCGCCRMRLLSDKVQTQSELSKSLARAVKRSRVIILCGPLFGEKGLIHTVSKVTDIPVEKLDNEAYDLDPNANIDVLSGATALITDTGVFGGCIIESNAQSIIILSESKSLRKNIMKQLIYPYITKLSIMPDDEPDDSDNNGSVLADIIVDGEDAVQDAENAADGADNGQNSANDVITINESDGSAEDEGNTAQMLDDFIIDISSADVAKPSSEGNGENGKDDSALIFDLPHNEDELTVEQKNEKYYLFEDESEPENDDTKINVAIKIIIGFIVLIAILILYLLIIKPLISHQNILTYLDNIFSSKLFIGFPSLF